jgi:hypothetical protein
MIVLFSYFLRYFVIIVQFKSFGVIPNCNVPESSKKQHRHDGNVHVQPQHVHVIHQTVAGFTARVTPHEARHICNTLDLSVTGMNSLPWVRELVWYVLYSPINTPNTIGAGINANKHKRNSEIPMDTGLSSELTHLLETKILL